MSVDLLSQTYFSVPLFPPLDIPSLFGNDVVHTSLTLLRLIGISNYLYLTSVLNDWFLSSLSFVFGTS